MAYLGANEAAFRLGNQAVSVYLGAVEVYSPSATLTFTGAVDSEWTELGNWSGGALPTASDSVIATASITSNSGSAPTVANFTMENGGFINLNIDITVTGVATFNGSAELYATITGGPDQQTLVTFNDSSVNSGTINNLNEGYQAAVTFNGTSENASSGTVTGDATFNDSATNNGTVTGNVTDNT